MPSSATTAQGRPVVDMIRVLVVDDHQMVADGLARGIAAEDDVEVIDVTDSMAGAIESARRWQPDVAVVDYRLPDGTGAATAIGIRSVSPDTRVLIVTGAAGDDVLLAAVEAGCSGLVSKSRGLAELVVALRLVAAGQVYVPPNLLANLLPRFSSRRQSENSRLTRREREVLQLLAAGMATPVIAERLVVSHHTVRNHVQRIIDKLGAHSKLEAVAVARKRGLLSPQH